MELVSKLALNVILALDFIKKKKKTKNYIFGLYSKS